MRGGTDTSGSQANLMLAMLVPDGYSRRETCTRSARHFGPPVGPLVELLGEQLENPRIDDTYPWIH